MTAPPDLDRIDIVYLHDPVSTHEEDLLHGCPPFGFAGGGQAGLARVVGQPIPQPSGTGAWVAFSPDGKTLATGNSHGIITLWNSTDLNHLTPRGRPLTVSG